MDHRFRYWMLTALAGVSLVLVLVNILLYDRNRNLQADIANRNLYISKACNLRTFINRCCAPWRIYPFGITMSSCGHYWLRKVLQ